MKRYLSFCLAFLLIACAAPATETISTPEITASPVTPLSAPNTPQPQSFLHVFDEAPIVSKGSYGTWDDRFTDPGAVVYYEGVFHMFRNGFRGFPATSRVGYVTSPDGYTWTKQGEEPVFETSDVSYAKIAMYASSALVQEDGTWVIYFYTWDSNTFPGSSVIGRATAPAPKGPWVADSDPVLLPGSVGEWDEQQVLAPHVLQSVDGYIMYYTGTDKAGKQQVGMATSTDGIAWTKYNDSSTADSPQLESDPVLQPAEKGSWDGSWAHQPRVIKTDENWVMFYRGTQDANGGKMALGLATSEDGIHWNKFAGNPIFLPNEISKSTQFWFDSVLFVNNTYFIFIEGDVSQTTQIYLATYEGAIPK